MRRKGTISVPFAKQPQPTYALLSNTRREPDSDFADAALRISNPGFRESLPSSSQPNAESQNQPQTLPAHDSIQDAADIPIDDTEISAIQIFYKGLIAAARSSLAPPIAAAFVRRLRDEKIMVMRAAQDRLRAARANRQKPKRPAHSAATPAYPDSQLG